MRDAPVSWQKILAQGFSDVDDLLNYLQLPTRLGSETAQQSFKTRVPRGFAARMQKGNPVDPLLLQVLAVQEELVPMAGYGRDPLEESTSNPLQGLIHKYKGRVLVTLTGTCAVNCRFCFRRHFPYQNNNPGREGWNQVFDYIRKDASIHEVILSGGDPMLASEAVMDLFLTTLAAIPHLRSVRFHTRIPVVLPERLDNTLLNQLAACSLRKIVVLHCNHAQEIDASVQQACTDLKKAGCHLLNQSVLLKGVNDDAKTLADLSERLFDCQVLPYYLHLLDKIAGSAHFDMPEERALAIFHQLQTLVPGYLLPRLAREEAGFLHKTLLV